MTKEQKYIKTYTDYNEAKTEADKTGLPLWDTRQIPDRYLVGHLTIEQEESDEAGDWIMTYDQPLASGDGWVVANV